MHVEPEDLIAAAIDYLHLNEHSIPEILILEEAEILMGLHYPTGWDGFIRDVYCADNPC